MPAADYRLRCPDCGAVVAVDAAMKRALVANGCVLCGTPLGAEDFEARSESASS